MIILRCTHKLLKEINLPKDELGDPGEGFLGSWFAYLFRLERRKCVMFTNDQTLYSFILFGLRKYDFDALNERFVSVLTANLLRDGIPSETLAGIDKACHPVAYGTTNSRSVLGSMNDLVQISKDMVSLQRQDILSEIAQLNHKLNRIPMRALKMVHAVREIRAVLNVSDCSDRAETFLQERVMEPRKIYVELKMSRREKTMILDDTLNDLGLEGRFEKSPDGKYFVAQLNHDELEDLVDFTAGLANHTEDAEVERELEGYYEKYHDLLLSMEQTHIAAVNKYLAVDAESGIWYGWVDMNTGQRLRPYFGALDAFMPAVLALAGDIERAEKLQASCFAMWNLHGIEPELIDFEKMSVAEGAEAYHLRPEIIESAYYLYHFTGDPVYVEMVLTTEAHPLRKTW